MAADQAAEREKAAWADAARYLRRDLLGYARDERFNEAFAAALPAYWNGLYTVDNAEEMSPNEAARFFDWFMFDYQADDRPRLIERYHQERRVDLAESQKSVLDAWLEAPPAAAYELLGYDGQTLHLRDFVTGEQFDVFEPGGHGQTEAGDVILGRLVPVHDRLEFSAVAAFIPKAEVAGLADRLAAARRAGSEGEDYAAFMRRSNTLLIHHALAQAEQQGRPPVARLNPNRADSAVRAAARGLRKLQRR
jgi:hypothetical protein